MPFQLQVSAIESQHPVLPIYRDEIGSHSQDRFEHPHTACIETIFDPTGINLPFILTLILSIPRFQYHFPCQGLQQEDMNGDTDRHQ
jgi:hypothetical protein